MILSNCATDRQPVSIIKENASHVSVFCVWLILIQEIGPCCTNISYAHAVYRSTFLVHALNIALKTSFQRFLKVISTNPLSCILCRLHPDHWSSSFCYVSIRIGNIYQDAGKYPDRGKNTGTKRKGFDCERLFLRNRAETVS